MEFFVQTQQLILGGRHPGLRAPRTREALRALAAAGHVSPGDRAALDAALVALRGWEHRVQMVDDAQAHRLPEADPARARVAALSGAADLERFDAQVAGMRADVSYRCSALYSDAEPLSAPRGRWCSPGWRTIPRPCGPWRAWASPSRRAPPRR